MSPEGRTYLDGTISAACHVRGVGWGAYHVAWCIICPVPYAMCGGCISRAQHSAQHAQYLRAKPKSIRKHQSRFSSCLYPMLMLELEGKCTGKFCSGVGAQGIRCTVVQCGCDAAPAHSEVARFDIPMQVAMVMHPLDGTNHLHTQAHRRTHTEPLPRLSFSQHRQVLTLQPPSEDASFTDERARFGLFFFADRKPLQFINIDNEQKILRWLGVVQINTGPKL